MEKAKLLFFKHWVMCWGLLLFLQLALSPASYGQQLVSSGGNYFVASTGSLTWSIGELIVETYTNENTALTQGFHQTYTYGVSAREIKTEQNFIAYPIPARDHVNILAPLLKDESYEYTLLDFTGRIISKGKIVNSPERISLSGLNSSVYFLRITENNKHVKTLRIIK
jgi:hypothetical protein